MTWITNVTMADTERVFNTDNNTDAALVVSIAIRLVRGSTPPDEDCAAASVFTSCAVELASGSKPKKSKYPITTRAVAKRKCMIRPKICNANIHCIGFTLTPS